MAIAETRFSYAVARVVFAAAMAAAGSWILTAQQPSGSGKAKKRTVTTSVLNNAAKDAAEWLTYGRDLAETHFSPLKQIDSKNVSRLGLAWHFNPELSGAFESAPLISNGVLYGTGAFSVVFAVDAQTGAYKWRFDPEVSRSVTSHVCCGPENRGLAIYNGKVYVAALDGRLIALDQETGKPIWSQQTLPENSSYSITAPPRIVKGKVIVGNSGAEFGVRGYITAYDADSGKQAWRFYTVPGDPSKPFEHPELEMAAKTWTGEWWKMGGGGTVWDGMAYDPDLNLLYIGTGNGSPWVPEYRSPGGGDNLFLASILAINPDTGRMKWYYQTTPREAWDFTAVQNLILADLNIGGRNRKVIMQAPKNGFFFVIDRATGEFLSAEMFTPVNWATGYDKKGRPIETPNARNQDQGNAIVIWGGGGGAHSWQPMSFSPITKLVYLPGQNRPFQFVKDPDFQFKDGKTNTGVSFGAGKTKDAAVAPGPASYLLAWDPVAQKERWRNPLPNGTGGGSMVTGGNLVFHGSGDKFVAYDATSGEKLWETTLAQTFATPVSYEIDGVQYVSILVGSGERGRLYTFALDGKEPMPVLPPQGVAGKAKAKAADSK